MNFKSYKGYIILLLGIILSIICYNPSVSDRYYSELAADNFYTRYLHDYTNEETTHLNYYSESDEAVKILVNGPLSLKAGEYEIILQYTAFDDSSVLNMFSTDYVNEDNTNGKLLVSEPILKEGTAVRASFTLEQDIDNIMLNVQTMDRAFSINHVSISSFGSVNNDSVFYTVMILATSLLIFLLLNLNPKKVQAANLSQTYISPKKVFISTCFILFCGVFIASIPVFQTGIDVGHDLLFHLARLTGMERALESGQFPIRVHGGTLNGYGYPNSLMYPEFLLYVPAFLITLGVHTITAYKFYIIMVNVLTVCVAYYAFNKISKSRPVALTAAIVYLLNPYRLICIYYRSAVGEFTAMIWLPLLAYGLYAVLLKNKKDWWALVVGASGVLQAHILTTEIVIIFCAFIGLFSIKNIFGKEKRIIPLAVSAAFIIGLNSWFIGPMLATMYQANLSVFTRVQLPEKYAIFNIEKLFATYSLDHVGPHPIGWVGIFSIGLYILIRIILDKNTIDKQFLKLFDATIIIAITALVATTAYFPWENIHTIPLIGSYLDAIQFPYRLLSMAGIAMALLIIPITMFVFKAKEHRIIACFAIIAFCIFTTSLFYENNYFQYNEPSYTSKYSYNNNFDNHTSIGQGEYLVGGADANIMIESASVVVSDNETLKVSNYKQYGTTMSFDYSIDFSESSSNDILIPFTYIPGYTVKVNNQPIEIYKNADAKVGFEPTLEQGQVTVKFESTLIYRFCEFVTLVAILMFIYRNKIIALINKKLKINLDI